MNNTEIETVIDAIWAEIRRYCNSSRTFNLLRESADRSVQDQLERAAFAIEELTKLIDNRIGSLTEANSDLSNEKCDLLRKVDSLKKQLQEAVEFGDQIAASSSEQFQIEQEGSVVATREIERLKAKVRLLEQESALAHEVSIYQQEPNLCMESWTKGSKANLDESVNKKNEGIVREQPTKVVGSNNIVMEFEKIARVTTTLVPMFNGIASPNIIAEVNQFISGCYAAKQQVPKEDQLKLLECIKRRLGPVPFESLQVDTITSLENLLDEIRKAYLPRKSVIKVIEEMLQIRMLPNEDVLQFSNKIKKAMEDARKIAKLSTTVGDNNKGVEWMLELAGKKAFKQGIREPIKQHLIMLDPPTFDELQKEALRIVGQLQEATQQPYIVYPGVNAVYPGLNQYNTQNMEVGAQSLPAGMWNPNQYLYDPHTGFPCSPAPVLQSGLGLTKPAGTVNVVQDNGKKELIKCSFCNEEGHVLKNCEKEQNTPFCFECGEYGHKGKRGCRPVRNNNGNNYNGYGYNGGNYNYNGNRGGNPPVCYFCNMTGHFQRDCQKRKVQDRAEQGSSNRDQGNQQGPGHAQ